VSICGLFFSSDLYGFEVGQFPNWFFDFEREVIELGDFGGGEKEAAVLFG
jgi:hypothetical protein